jgi:murein DD-endopeptidase MepM/ murein hydrolase activator NlpD
MRIASFLIFSSLFISASYAQDAPPSARYINPMDIPVDLSGNFMEPRSNHFHSGLDMRTQGQEGIPVKAIADGWVSRIKISPWGYGKAIYIDHGDGHTSVYGHLQRLKGPVADACLDAQYKARDFSIDIYPEKGSIPVKQGEVVALSGNTGSSGGPHLHFEIRRTGDQRAIDPEGFGFLAPDRVPPEIVGVRIYPLTDSSLVAPYPGKARGHAAQGGAGRYGLKPGETPTAYGTVGLALHTFDRYDNGAFKLGVRSIELFVDSVPVFSTRFTEVDFDQNRYCNAHVDHALFKEAKMDYHRCYKLPNNKLRIYGKEPAQGRIALEPGRSHHVRFVVIDGRGNTSQLEFMLQGATLEQARTWPQSVIDGSLFRYDANNVLVEEGVRMTVPAGALYDDTYIRYTRKAAPAKAVAPLHIIHTPLTPLHTACELELALPDLPERLRSKVLVVSISEGGSASAVGGKWADGSLTASVKAFGSYTAMVDTIKPTISNVDLRADMRGRSSFSVKISDELSGIGTFKGSINGQWVLLEYEPKTKTLSHTFDKHSSAVGSKEFKLEVSDDRGNLASWSMSFTR